MRPDAGCRIAPAGLLRAAPLLAGLVLAGLVLAGCAAPPPPHVSQPPLAVGGGLGSQHGNYAARRGADVAGPDGERCIAFEWDRPVSATQAVRYVSLSCPSREIPGRMEGRQVSRSLIPLSESHVED